MSAAAFHVMRVHPPGFVHANALVELAEYLHAMLVELGHPATLGVNTLAADARAIVVGAHLLDAAALAALPPSAIVVNSEPLAAPPPFARHAVWDYTAANLAAVPHARLVPFGFCAALVRHDRVRSPGEALVFHGVQNRRRRAVLAALAAARVPVRAVTGEYGVSRDVRLARARAALNLHKTDDLAWFEPVRCFYALVQGVPVISEATTDPAADAFRDAMDFLPAADFAPAVAERLADPAFERIAAARLARFAARSPLPAFAALVAATLRD